MNQPDVAIKGIVGIQNMGNMCYVNAVIHALRTCQELTMFCLTHSVDELASKRVVLAYKDIVATIWSAHRPAYVRPLAFISEISHVVRNTPYDMFGQHMQQDAHEYLSYLLDRFHEELSVPVEFELEEKTMESMAKKAWNHFLMKKTSIIVDTCFGMLRKTVICSNCQNKTYQWELFNSLKIPCEGETLYDWIRKEVNEVTDIHEYKCDSCNGKYSAKKYSHIWKLPNHLFIVLDRFQIHGMKIMTTCPLIETLSLSDYYAEEVKINVNYELCGIVDHHGMHMHGGHYTAQFKHPISREWWHFDDERSHELGVPRFVPSNYILSYRIL
jgi:ubiquitin C-terminal hydrolase